MVASADESFDEAYVELFVLAQRVAHRVLGSPADAEDIAAETMVRAMSSWRRVHAYSAPWVSRVALNMAIDQVRRRPMPLTGNPTGPAVDPTDRIALAVALKKLPTRQCEALVLRYMAGFSGAATAAAMGLGAETVKTHVQRGLAAMRHDLGAELKETIDAA